MYVPLTPKAADNRDGTKNMRQFDQINQSLLYYLDARNPKRITISNSSDSQNSIEESQKFITKKTRETMIKKLVDEMKVSEGVSKIIG